MLLLIFIFLINEQKYLVYIYNNNVYLDEKWEESYGKAIN